MNYLVLKITGKAFSASPQLLRRYVNVIKSLLDARRLVVVTGGGAFAREYIEIAKAVGVESNYWLDLIGIAASRLNSILLISALGSHAYPRPPESIEEVVKATGCYKLVVVGGLIPGQSTASVLLQVAEALGTRRVYYYSAIGKVYDKDPTKYPDAKPLSVITARELKHLLDQKAVPGEYALIDANALEISMRSGIEIQLLDYKEPEQIHHALEGENPGTVIIPR